MRHVGVRFGDCELSVERIELRRAGQIVDMEPQVFDVLAYLLRHRERVVPKTELLDQIWCNRFVSEHACCQDGAGARVSARVKVRPKAQLTLPEEIRRALHISEGDEVEFAVHDDGTITVRGFVSIPTDQAWFFTPQWLAREREADEDIAAGRGTVNESAQDMFACLDTLGAADS